MIAGLKGTLFEKESDAVVIDVGGVRYLCHVSLNTLFELGEPGRTLELWTHTHVREDALQLYGFSTKKERELFLLLVSVQGIGPRLALNICSGMPPKQLVDAIASGEAKRLQAVSGVGKKTAERIVLELSEKVAKKYGVTSMGPGPASRGFAVSDEVSSALLNLGYKKKDVEAVCVRLGKELSPDVSFEKAIREALAVLQK